MTRYIRRVLLVAALSASALAAGVWAEIGDAPLLPYGPKGAAHNRGASPISPPAVSLPAGAFDAVGTVQGDILKGKVIAITPEGTLSLVGDSFLGEAKVWISAIEQITLQSAVEDAGRDTVLLTNGDRVTGTLTGITPKSVVLRSVFAAPLEIPRSFVVSVSLGAKTALPLLDTSFASGKMEPWESRGGSWSVRDGALTCDSGGNSSVSVKLDQKEAVTFVAKLKNDRNRAPFLQCNLVLFADSVDPPYGRNSVYAMFSRGTWQLGYCREGGNNQVASGAFNRGIQEGAFRVAYDPGSGKAQAWLDSALLGEATIPIKPAQGQHVMLTTPWPCSVSSLQVLRGVAPPGAIETGAGEEEADVVVFANKDRVSGKDVLLSDGLFVIETEFGRLTPKAESLGVIVFRKKGREEPRKLKGDVQVLTSAGRMTLQFKELTPERLVGTSGSYGDLTIKRSSIQGIRFNLYR